MTVRIEGTLLAPLGTPIEGADIRLTALDTLGNVVRTAVSVAITDEAGNYGFDVHFGRYLLEVNVTDFYSEQAEVIADEATPTPIGLDDWINYTTPVIPPEVQPDDPIWEDLYNDLDTAFDTEKRCKVDQISDGDVYVNESKCLTTNDRLLANTAEENVATNSGTSTHNTQVHVYGDQYSNNSIQLSSIGSTGDAQIRHVDGVYEASNGNVNISSDKHITTLTSELREKKTLTNTELSRTDTLTVGGTGTVLTDYADVGTLTKLDTYTLNLGLDVATMSKSAELTDQYRNDLGTLVPTPRAKQEDVISLISTNHDILVSDLVTAYEDVVGTPVGQAVRKIVIDGVETCQIQSVEGGVSKQTTIANNYIIEDSSGNPLVDFDTVADTMRVYGSLIVENSGDFKGDPGNTVFEVYQYSQDNGVTDPWHDDFLPDDKWRRFNTSINGVIDPATWSDGYLLVAEDGLDGDTYFIDYLYSTGNILVDPYNPDPAKWHETLVDGDMYRIECLVIDGVYQLPWSQPAAIAGADGADGEIVFEEYLYNLTWENAPVLPTDPVGSWHANLSPGDHFRISRLIKYPAGTPIPVPPTAVASEITDWSTPTKIIPEKDVDYFDGAQGEHGQGSFYIRIISVPVTDADKDNAVAAIAQRPAKDGDLVNFYYDVAGQEYSSWFYRGSTIPGVWDAAAFVVNGDAVIDGTLAAKKLIAGTITGDKISSNTSIFAGTGNNIAIMSGSDANWRFSAGNASMGSSPFRVDKAGKLYASGVDIDGHIDATSGTFAGSLNAATGTFSGSLSAATGTFSGNLSAAGGTFTGTLNGVDGNFSGTVQANKIQGNLTSTKATAIAAGSYSSNTWFTVASASVNASSQGFSRNLYVLGCALKANTNSGPETRTLYWRVLVGGSVVKSGSLQLGGANTRSIEVGGAGKIIGTGSSSIQVQVRTDNTDTSSSWSWDAQTLVFMAAVDGGDFT